MKTTADRLLDLRHKLRLKQAEFGKRIGLSRTWVSRLERGEEASPAILLRLADLERQAGIASTQDESLKTSEKEYTQRSAHDENVLREDSVQYGEGQQYDLGNARHLLKRGRVAKGWTIDQLAKKVGYQTGVLQAIEEGSARASAKVIEKLERVLDLEPGSLYAGAEPGFMREDGLLATMGSKPNIATGKDVGAPRYIPLISYAQAGKGSWTDEAYEHESVVAFGPSDPNGFAVRLRGDSMEPKYSEGDIIYLAPNSPPRTGDVVLAKIDDDHGGDVMCKLYSTRDAGKHVILSSYNPAHPPLDIDRKILQFIYPVTGVLKMLRR